jgi:hypothetical protein
MGGDVHLRDDAAWVVSYGTYDNVISQIQSQVRESQEQTLVRMLEEAQEPYLRHLDLRSLDGMGFRKFARAVQFAYDQSLRSGAGEYGGHPDVYDRFMKDFAELLELIRADARMP